MKGHPVAVVTGVSTGIGRATAIYLAEKGYAVYGTVRPTSRLTTFNRLTGEAGVDIKLVEVDLADDDSVRRGFDEMLSEAGRIDVLVNNAGVGGNGVLEEVEPAVYLDVMNINLCGAVRCLQSAVPVMRAQQSGTIVNVTSMVGRVAAIAQSPYVASKFALEGVSEALAQELVPFGIRVVIIEPGVTKTAIFAKAGDLPHVTGAYDAHYRRMLRFYSRGIEQATDPTEVAHVIHEAITTDSPRLRYATSWGGTEMIEGRSAMSDKEWVELGGLSDDEEYFSRFRSHFNVDV